MIRCSRSSSAEVAAAPRTAHRAAFVAILLEHKSRPDKWTALQVLAYVVSLWRRLRRRAPTPHSLPPVLPVVVHFGRGRWRTSTDLESLVDLDCVPESLRSTVASCLPQFGFAVHDFAGRSTREVRSMALSVQGLCTVSLLQFLAPVGRDDERVAAVIADWKDVARQIAESPTGQDAWRAVTLYTLRVTRLGRDRLRTVIAREIGTPAMKKFVSTYDQILQEGEAKGRAEGRAEQLLRLLEKRFSEVPAPTEVRIRRASIEDLDRWALRVLDATSLDGVFRDA